VRGDRSWSGDGRGAEPHQDADARGGARDGRVRRNLLEPAHGDFGGTTERPESGGRVRRQAPGGVIRQIEPNRVDVERRGEERRVVDEPVAEDRRVEDRRAMREQEAAESRERRSYAVSRVIMAVDYLFYLLYGLLAVRFVLALVGASEQAGFVQFINGITQPFYAPFAGIVARPAMNGGVLDFPILIALLAYALLHMAVRGMLRLMISPRV
jgi:YggT family protein